MDKRIKNISAPDLPVGSKPAEASGEVGSKPAEASSLSRGEGWWQPAMAIFTQVTVWIAGPIILALFIGKWLDKKYATEPWLFLAAVGAAFAVSCLGIVRIALNYIKKLEQELKEKDSTQINNHEK